MKLHLLIALLALSCDAKRLAGSPARPATGGNAVHGQQVIASYGCGACHAIPGVRGARGTLAASLDCFAKRTYIAGELPNVPENLERWLQDPASIRPRTAMPNLGLGSSEARDVAAYLYSLD